MPWNKSLRLGEILLEEGLITHAQLMETLQIQKKDPRKFGEICIERGFITEPQLAKILAELYQLPYVLLTDISIDENILSIVSLSMMQKHKVVPFELEGSVLKVAIGNPLDVAALQEIQYLSGFQVDPVVAGVNDIKLFLDKNSQLIESAAAFKTVRDSGANSTPVIKYVESLIGKAVRERASDIHLEPMQGQMRVRFRIDGVMYERQPVPKELERKVLSRIKILSGMDVADSRRPQDGRMNMPTEFSEYDVRVSTLPDIMGENMALRILDKSFTKFSLDTLGMSMEEADTIKRLIFRPYGIILVTGPTGAGKTTTLYSMLNTLNAPSRNIITVEDPVEYKLPGISQTLINVRAGYTFATAIRHILRHDPNVIMIGEIRDQETAEIAIRAALTGHLVLSTLHTNTASGAIMRLLDMGIEPFLIQSSVIAVIAQRLVRRLCPNCKKEYEPSGEVCERIAREVQVTEPVRLAEPAGCEQCFSTGFAGRAAVYELLQINEPIRQLILKSPSEQDISKAAVLSGMKTLRRSGLVKALERTTSLAEVMGITFLEGE